MRIILLLLLLVHFSASAQKINQYDAAGKKHGSWSVYVDSSLCETDSLEASFKAFSEYVHGKNTLSFECSKWKRKLRVDHSKNTSEGKLLDGEVSFYNAEDKIVEHHIYSRGKVKYYKSFNYGGEDGYYWTETYYFDSLYENIQGSYFYESKNNQGLVVSTGWYRDGPKGWQVYESEDFEDVYFVAGDSTLGVFEASKTDYKWPYYGYNVPRYLAAVVGYEGISYGTIELGLAGNISDTYLARKTGSMIGASILFRYNHPVNPDSVSINVFDTISGNPVPLYWTPDTSFWGVAIEIGNYSLISYGIGYNFNTDGTTVTHGVRPFVGTTLYNLQILYGYNIFSKKKNRIGRLLNSRIMVRYAIPLPRKKYKKRE